MRRSNIRVVRTTVVLLAVAGLALEACDADLDDLDSAAEEPGVTEDVDPEPEPEEPEETEESEPEEAEEPEPDGQGTEAEAEAEDASAQDASTEAEPAGVTCFPSDGDEGDVNRPEAGVDQVPAADLPGEDAALYFAEEGQWVHVVGVAHDDVLNVRALPDPTAEIVGCLPSFAEAQLAGREQRIGVGGSTAQWVEVRLVGGYGWVNGNFLAHAEGDGQDVIDDFFDYGPYANIDDLIDAALDGRDALPSADRVVARHLDGASSDVSPGAPIYYKLDFVGGWDDSVRGERVKFDVEQNADGYYISWARSVQLCYRGATADGQCV